MGRGRAFPEAELRGTGVKGGKQREGARRDGAGGARREGADGRRLRKAIKAISGHGTGWEETVFC